MSNPTATDFNTYFAGQTFNLEIDGLRELTHTLESVVESVDGLAKLVAKVIKMEQSDGA